MVLTETLFLGTIFLSIHYSNGYIEPRIVLSQSQCGKLEYYNDCGTKCLAACKKTSINCDECVSGCFCKKPYIRSFMGGPCVRYCPLKVVPKPHWQRRNITRGLRKPTVEANLSLQWRIINTHKETNNPEDDATIAEDVVYAEFDPDYTDA